MNALKNYVFLAIKNPHNSKERLDIAPNLKRELCRLMFLDVSNALQSSSKVDKVVVISPDRDLLQDLPSDFQGIFEEPPIDLNHAIQIGLAAQEFTKSDTLLILHADLPLLTPDDVDSFFQISVRHEKIVILAPSLRKDGTNAMLLKPPTVLTPSFGIDSFNLHLKRARTIPNLQVHVHSIKNVALDIDIIEDLELLLNSNTTSLTLDYLKKVNFFKK